MRAIYLVLACAAAVSLPCPAWANGGGQGAEQIRDDDGKLQGVIPPASEKGKEQAGEHSQSETAKSAVANPDVLPCFSAEEHGGVGLEAFEQECATATDGCPTCSSFACQECAITGSQWACGDCANFLEWEGCANLCCRVKGEEVCGNDMDEDCDGLALPASPENVADGLCAGGLLITSDFTFPPGTYVMANTVQRGVVTIGAAGVTLDCAGATIEGIGPQTGIMCEGLDGVTIKNCRTVNTAGIDSRGCTNLSVLDNEIVGPGALCMCAWTTGLAAGNVLTSLNGGLDIVVNQSEATLMDNDTCGASGTYFCQASTVVDGGNNVGNPAYMPQFECPLALTACP
jgi:hypothetical protein